MADDAATSAGQSSDALELQELRACYAAARDRTALAEAEDRQAATAELLRVIATSSSTLSSVFEAIAERAYRLCRASAARVYVVEGDLIRVVASVAESNEAVGTVATTPDRLIGFTLPLAPERASMAARTVLDGRVLSIA